LRLAREAGSQIEEEMTGTTTAQAGTVSTAADSETTGRAPQLKGNLGTPGVLMQAIGHIGPATGAAFAASGIVALTLGAAPVALLVAGLIVMLIGVGLTQLARYLPSAGGYFTYVSRGVGPRAGFFVAWLSFLYDPILIAAVWAFAGAITESILRSEYGIHVPWWAIWAAGVALVTLFSYRGVELSVRVIVALGVLEIIAVLALAISGLIDPGPGGFSLKPFDPGSAPNFNSLYLGVVFSIFLFTGFESVAPLAEESRDPRRTLPKAIMISILITTVVYVLAGWGMLVGWGVNRPGSFAADPSPLFTLGHRLWGGAWIILLVAVLNSVLAVTLAAQNSATRVFFAMARSGVLPRWLSRVHRKHHTPVAAIALQTVITLALGLIGGEVLGPIDMLVFGGLATTLSMVLVYSMGNLAVWRLFRNEHRAEFHLGLHLLAPALSSAALLWVGYKSVAPLPTGAAKWAPVLVGAWIVSGAALTWWVSRPGRSHWMERARMIMGDTAPADEL
jgi:amino acid transporter